MQGAEPRLQSWRANSQPGESLRKMEPVRATFTILFAWYVVLIVGAILRQSSSTVLSDTERWTTLKWRIEPTVATAVEAVGAAALANQFLFLASIYLHSLGSRRAMLLPQALFGCLSFVLHAFAASDTLRAPVDLYDYLKSTLAACLCFVTANALHKGSLATAPVTVISVCFLLGPVPLTLAARGGAADATWPLPVSATVAACLLVSMGSAMYKIARQRQLELHWTVRALGAVVCPLWLLTYTLQFCVALDVHGVTSTHARVCFNACIITTFFMLHMAVIQAIDSTQEALSLKSDLERVRAELALCQEQQRVGQSGEEARQQFLHFVFREIRLLFNSIDSALNALLGDLGLGDAVSVPRTPALPFPYSPSSEGWSLAWSHRDQPTAVHLAGEAGTPSGAVTLPDHTRDTIDAVCKASAGLKAVVNDSLDWIQLHSLSKEVILCGACSVQKAVSDAFHRLAAATQQSGVILVQRTEAAVQPFLLADRVRIEQALTHCISTALQAAPQDGSGQVSVTVYALEDQGHVPKRHKEAMVQAAEAAMPYSDWIAPFTSEGVCWLTTSPPTFSASQSHASQPTHRTAEVTTGGPDASTVLQACFSEAETVCITARPSGRGGPHVVDVRPEQGGGATDRSSQLVEKSTARGQHTTLSAFPTEHASLSPLSARGYVEQLVPTCTPPTLSSTLVTRLRSTGYVPASSLTQPFVAHAVSVSSSGAVSVKADVDAAHARGSLADGPCLQTIVISIKGNGSSSSTGADAHPFLAIKNKREEKGDGRRSAREGSDLKLAIAREIVLMHGGCMGVRSFEADEDGAEMLLAFRLPVLSALPRAQSTSPSSHPEGRSPPVSDPKGGKPTTTGGERPRLGLATAANRPVLVTKGPGFAASPVTIPPLPLGDMKSGQSRPGAQPEEREAKQQSRGSKSDRDKDRLDPTSNSSTSHSAEDAQPTQAITVPCDVPGFVPPHV